MAILCTPDDLAEPIACLGNQDQQTLLAQIVYLLCQLNSMACDPDTLAEIQEVRCLQNWDQQSLLAAAVYQLCLLNGGGGGSALLEVYQDRDPLPPNDPTKGALNYPLGGGALTQWDILSQAWV